MNSDYEKNSLSATAMEALIQANGQAVETRQRIPYEMVVYAIPEEWREEEMNLLRQAVQFQPTLYKQIDTLATRQDLQHLLTDQRTVLQAESREMQSSMRRILQQDGSVREQNFSRTSDLLSENRKDILQLVERLESKLKKIIIGTAVSSVTLSVLVCLALQHWVG